MKRLAFIVLFAAPAFGQMAAPNAALTPGVTRPLTTKAICATKWGKDERHVTQEMKKGVCVAYGIASGCPGKAYELDHLISRELAGADDAKNLWPQPIAQARLKDRLENRLHVEVCAGRISLEEAQREISTDWWTVYQRYFPAEKQQIRVPAAIPRRPFDRVPDEEEARR